MSKNNFKMISLRHIKGRSILPAYRICRRAGLAPWCSVCLVLLSRMA